MKALIQRVTFCKVTIDGKEVRETGPGLLVLFGCAAGDELSDCVKLAEKTANLRIFPDGEGKMNAYFVGPNLGPDDYFHVAWVWRDTPDAATNHDLSYARSPDLIHWEKSNGEPYELPITLGTGEIVDDVPARGGLLNSRVAMAFDRDKRVVITYTKYDEKGSLQIWNARLEENGWNKVSATDWDFTWKFGGGGSLTNEFSMSSARVVSEDKLAVSWTQVIPKKSGTTYLDAATLKPCNPPVSSPKASRPEYEREVAWTRERRRVTVDRD